MKLIALIMNRMSAVLLAALLGWSMLFYFTLYNEIIDEVDDSLELYSESLMRRYLSGEEIPPREIGTNNSYSIIPVSEEYAAACPPISFSSRDIWISLGHETEPARVMRMIFRDNDNKPLLLEVATPTFDVDELQQAILIWSFALYVILFIVIITINWGVIQRSMRPLYSLLEWMDHFDLRKNNKQMINDTKVSEFRKLIDTANRQVLRMQELYDQQKNFVDNAAHEMQTPLAVCLNRLEEFQQRTDLTEGQYMEIDKVRQPLIRLKRLHRDMLQLSRISNGAYTLCSDINLYEKISRMKIDFSEVFSNKNIVCKISGNISVKVSMNESLADLLFGNLFRNAWIHTKDGGLIEILLDKSFVKFSNSGESALNPDLIFQRFYHSSANGQSSGLGLSICDSVCRQYGFRLTYAFEGGMHVFTCSF